MLLKTEVLSVRLVSSQGNGNNKHSLFKTNDRTDRRIVIMLVSNICQPAQAFFAHMSYVVLVICIIALLEVKIKYENVRCDYG